MQGDRDESPRPAWREKVLDLGIALALIGASAAVYLQRLQTFKALPGYHDNINLLFGLDQLDALRGWVEAYKATHPFLLLIVVPLSKLLGFLAGDYERGLAWYAVGTGAALVAAVFVLARACAVSRGMSAGIAAAFAMSLSQLVFGALADSYSLAGLATVPAFLLLFRCLADRRLRFGLWVVGAVLAFGITATQAAPVAICFAVAVTATQPRSRWLLLLGALVLATAGIGLSLNVAQRAMFPTAGVSWDADLYRREAEAGFIAFPLTERPLFVARETLKTFFVFNVMGPVPAGERFRPGERLELVYRDVPLDGYGAPHWTFIVLWLVLLAAGSLQGLRSARTRPIAAAAWISLLYHMLLHTVYGTYELYLYTAHFTFLVFLAAATGMRGRGRAWTLAFWVLAAIFAWHNLHMLDLMATRYAQTPYEGGAPPIPLVGKGELWRHAPADPPSIAQWSEPSFRDDLWWQGSMPLGYGIRRELNQVRRLRGRTAILLTRTGFTLEHPDSIADLWLDIAYDDGFIAYLNGVEVAKAGVEGPLAIDSRASAQHSSSHRHRFFLDTDVLVPEGNVLAIAVLNSDLWGPDLYLDATLSAELTPE